MKLRLTILALILTAPSYASDCGGLFGFSGDEVGLSSKVCREEASTLIRKLKSGDYSARKNAKLLKEDLKDIVFIYDQKGRTYHCGIKGYLLVTNMTGITVRPPFDYGTRTAICVKTKRGGKLQLYSVEREIDHIIMQ